MTQMTALLSRWGGAMYTSDGMSPKVEELLAQAALLDERERAELASELLAGLDGPEDENAKAAWAEEIERRARLASSGESEGLDWESVRDEAQRRIAGK